MHSFGFTHQNVATHFTYSSTIFHAFSEHNLIILQIHSHCDDRRRIFIYFSSNLLWMHEIPRFAFFLDCEILWINATLNIILHAHKHTYKETDNHR